MEVLDAPELTPELLRRAKRHGFSDAQIGKLRGMSPATSSAASGTRSASGRSSRPSTPARPSSPPRRRTTTRPTTRRPRSQPRERPAVIILGSGPNRIGQGIEFDYSCVHAASRCRPQGGAGYETIMVNCNPETVSTDYDTSDRLYFEPLTLEDVLEIVHAEQAAGPVAGVICQLGGQTPLGLAQGLKDAGVPIVGTSPGGDPPRRGARRVRPGARRGRPARAQARHRHRPSRRRSGSPTRSATRCWCARRTSSAAAAWRSSTTTTRCAPTSTEVRRRGPDRPERAGAGRPVPRRRRRDRRRRALRRRGALPRRRDGAHRGGRHPLRRLRLRAAADHARPRRHRADPRVHRGDRPRRRGARPAQRAVRAGRRRALRPRGQPARLAARCRSSPRRPPCRWPRPRPG